MSLAKGKGNRIPEGWLLRWERVLYKEGRRYSPLLLGVSEQNRKRKKHSEKYTDGGTKGGARSRANTMQQQGKTRTENTMVNSESAVFPANMCKNHATEKGGA